ncbi:MAG: hypothetical protein DMG24_10500 [Acidobacteria bacterium]|nr:MAG: hypothetical protein DMG24_10500 [Acidobacteriota bacterium]
MKLTIPELSLVVLIGPSGSGKSTFARKHFKATEILSSDFCRALVSDDENDQAATKDAFEILHFVGAKRLAAGRLVVVDATNVQPEARKPLVALAREYHCIPVGIVLNLPEKICQERNRPRENRDFGPHVIRQQSQQLRRSLRGLDREGFRKVFILSSPEEVESALIERERLWNNLKHEHGPFDIIGDVHGCFDELQSLLGQLGYEVSSEAGSLNGYGYAVRPPEGRKAVFLGDLVDRGPKIPAVLRLVMSMVKSGSALCVPGNHDMKLVRKLRGKNVQITHGLADSLEQIDREPPEFKEQAAAFLDDLISHYLLDDGKLVVAHAGMRQEMQGRGSSKVRDYVTVREENALAALEVMSRFAANPKWLIYLPPTMSPSATTQEPGLLEHPAEAFAYYRGEGIPKVVCEEKHMGSRAVVIVCRDEGAVVRRFGLRGEGFGICYTRTGRRFFENPIMEAGLLDRVRSALDGAGFWEQLRTDWVCLDCELMPWSVKAQELLRQQYAAVGAASRAGLADSVATLELATHNNDVTGLLERFRARAAAAARYVDAYRRYCWPVHSLNDLRLAPFHLLATEGKVHANKDHAWHMETLARVCQCDSTLLLATPWNVVDVTDSESEARAVAWWEDLTNRGGEGMVVKPLEFVAKGRRGLVQPAVKCRGREYLRIIYGPEYTLPEHLDRLRSRGLAAKRSLALREFALGIEALERFVRWEPLRRVHECVFGVLALESEPVDPRL